MKALIEIKKAEMVSQKLQSTYGLSAKRSTDIAKLATSWSKLSKTRSMTSADANAFSNEVLGFDLTEGISAYRQASEGNRDQLDSLIEQASRVNNITPEHMNNLVNTIFKF